MLPRLFAPVLFSGLLLNISVFARSENSDLEFSPEIDLSDSRLKIRSESGLDEKAARLTVKQRVAVLKRYLAKQIDPYTGEATENSDCKMAEALRSSAKQISETFVLMVSPSLAIDCYGESPDRKIDNRQFLYCKRSKTVYVIDFYHSPNEKPEVPVARCH